MNIPPKVAAGIVGFVAVALALFVWTQVEQSKRAQEASLRDIKAQNLSGEIKMLAESYDKQRKENARSAEEARMRLEGEYAMADAKKALALAELAAAEQAQLSQEPDVLKRAVIKAQANEKRVAIRAGK
jgi:hypothetical protein